MIYAKKSALHLFAGGLPTKWFLVLEKIMVYHPCFEILFHFLHIRMIQTLICIIYLLPCIFNFTIFLQEVVGRCFSTFY
jgi:hypothetical protein